MNRTGISLVALFMSLAFPVWADGVSGADLSQTQFNFKHQTFTVGTGNRYVSEQNWRDSQSVFLNKGNNLSGQLEQYDATITYPFAPRESINFDLGINIRFIDGDLMQNELDQSTHNVNAALPMLYANAMFGRPYDGLSASLGASHFEYEQYYALDYRAKLSYQWQNGFGMEGGWQHQELSIDSNDFQTDIEKNGLFLDFKYRF